jgi:hypothetical protein
VTTTRETKELTTADDYQHLTTAKQVPNFDNYIYENALKAIKPEAVKIVR